MLLAFWQRLPVMVRAVLAGGTVAAIGLLPWVMFVSANQKVLTSIPWAVIPTSLWLWVFWRYLRGEGWPRSTSEARHSSLRANSLSGDAWTAAIIAGILGFMALMPLLGLMGKLVVLPSESQPINVSPQIPFFTVFILLVMAAIVAGVVEEAGFRGYLQGPIERRHGPIVALLTTGALFGVLHFTHHPDSVLAMMPYYLAVAGIYGGLAYVTNSIWPGLVLHAGGDVFVLNRLWLTGKPEWQQTSEPPKLIWESGPDAAFWGYLVAFLVLGAATVWAFVALRELVINERRVNSPSEVPTVTVAL
jgi:membrane protease YdiL (CAAX protease family)